MMEPNLSASLCLWSGLAGFVGAGVAVASIVVCAKRRMRAVLAKNKALQTLLDERQTVEDAHRRLQTLFVDACSIQVEGLQQALFDLSSQGTPTQETLGEAQDRCWELLAIGQRAAECIDACKPIKPSRMTPTNMVEVLTRLSKTWGASHDSISLRLSNNVLTRSAVAIAARFELDRSLARLLDHMEAARKPAAITARLRIQEDRLQVRLEADEAPLDIQPAQAETWEWIAGRYLANMGGRLTRNPFGFTLDLPLAPHRHGDDESGPCPTLRDDSEYVA